MIGDMAVVQTTARAFVLRDGHEVLKIINQGFDPVGINAGTGTGTAELQRVVTAPMGATATAPIPQAGAAK
jgi:type IV secretion system protein VirB9